MPSEISASSGLTTTSTTNATTMSISRVTIPALSPDRHEDLGRLQADLGAPRPGPVPEGFQGAWVRVLAHLALVAGHGLDLGFQGVRDVHPGVGHEGPGIGPLGAARRVE